MIETLQGGRDAFTRHAWAEAVEAFTAAHRDPGLSPEDLELLGSAAWWSGHPDESNEALERAFAAHDEAGHRPEAARVAMNLAYQAFRGLAVSVGGGWLARAERLLADHPESPAHAGLAVFQAAASMMGGRWEEGIALADQAMDSARRVAVPGVLSAAMSFKGMADVFIGKVKEGLADLDEAAAAASSGELDLRTASDIHCTMLAACRSVGDLERAGQWAAEGERWMRRNGAGGYPGICRVHRAELKMLHGQWSEAEQEARQACNELERFRLLDAAGYAHYQVGEIRLRMGDLDGAAEAFDRAYEHGHDAQPGLALLQLERGAAGPAGGPRDVRATRRDARPPASRQAPRRGSRSGGPAARVRPRHPDVHVHRHRDLHRPRRRDRRRGLVRGSALARPRAARRDRRAPRRRDRPHRRRLLRGLRARCRWHRVRG